MAANRKRVDEPPLDDDTNWLKLPKAHHILSELLKEDTPFFYYLAKRQLFEALRNEELDCMRESRTNPIKRERVHAPFWPRHGILEKALLSSNPISRTKGPGTIFGWDYYVWKPHFDQLWSRPQTEQNVRERGEPPGPTPTPSRPDPPPHESAPAPAPAPAPPQQRRRAQGGGMKPKLRERQIEEGKQLYRDMLAEDPTWAKTAAASAERVKEKLKLAVHWRTVERHIIKPVLEERLTK